MDGAFQEAPRKTLTPVQGLAITDAPEGLGQLHHAACAGVAWQREPLPEIQAWLDDLSPAHWPRARIVVPPLAVRTTLTELLDATGTPAGPERDCLIDDIAALADMFADLMASPYVRVRMEVVDTNACRLFHVDQLTARMICTYRGPGTEFGRAKRGQVPEVIGTVPTGSVYLMRGSLWPVVGAQEDVLLHRSPPVEGTGQTRFVLVLDGMQEAQEDGPQECI